ncbi:MAG: hypothetical protein ABIH21_04880 [Patescibacteria group bacterium]
MEHGIEIARGILSVLFVGWLAYYLASFTSATFYSLVLFPASRNRVIEKITTNWKTGKWRYRIFYSGIACYIVVEVLLSIPDLLKNARPLFAKILLGVFIVSLIAHVFYDAHYYGNDDPDEPYDNPIGS